MLKIYEMKLLYLMGIFAFLHTHMRLVSSQTNSLKVQTNSPKDTINNLLDNIYRVFKQITALPAKLGSNVLNLICTAFIKQIKKHIPDKLEPKVENIKFQLRTACDKRAYPINNLSGLAADKNFDRKKMTVIVATGWTTMVDNSQHDMLAKAYHCRGDTNYLALDVDYFVNTLYTWSSQNTDDIGKHVAEGLQHLTSFVDITNLHLMGHSLGAQIMGSAARHYRVLTGRSLTYVTGLDPAFPCFSTRKALATLSANDADFVDIIHTNPGILGQYETHGHVGFYVGGKIPIKDGCDTTGCSHSIAVSYYTESIYPNNTRNFIAKRCESSDHLKCHGREDVMGYAVSRNVRVTYVLHVNAKSPYGKNANQQYTNPTLSKCGHCGVANQ